MLRKLLDQIEPLFHKGGKFEKLYPLYEANDTFLYNTGEVTKGGTHVRDALDTKRMKVSFDVTKLDGSPLTNTATDIVVGDDGLLFRGQFQAEF